MKRLKESGAAFRKRRKEREELIKKHKGALLQFMKPKETTTNIDQTTTETGELCESKPLSDSNVSTPSDSSTTSNIEHVSHEKKVFQMLTEWT